VLVKRASTVELDWDTRQKSRFDATDSAGRRLGVFLPRGSVVRGGDVLVTEDGSLVRVLAAAQPVLRVAACTEHGMPLDLMRAAYHLGHRHVQLEIRGAHLQLEPDPVLADMLCAMHLIVAAGAPFSPGGAYAGRPWPVTVMSMGGSRPRSRHEHDEPAPAPPQLLVASRAGSAAITEGRGGDRGRSRKRWPARRPGCLTSSLALTQRLPPLAQASRPGRRRRTYRGPECRTLATRGTAERRQANRWAAPRLLRQRCHRPATGDAAAGPAGLATPARRCAKCR
jgi:urease accessory protein UreE